ncbi:MAG: 3-phosphoshikimate 1-carboxyvinyltransferase [Thermoanaerobaculia bacterium]|nr:3-phosphoshikimate 1-carboxyvinyltransferase [Thermoanaerobaculia bacterium]
MAFPSTSEADSTNDLYGPLPAGGAVQGRLRVPGSKSVAQRYLALALLARREILLRGAPAAEDVQRFLSALRSAGWTVEEVGAANETPALRLKPPAGEPSADRIVPVDCGAGGTMYRFLTAVLCAVPGRWRIDGTPRLRERPVGPLVAALRPLGAEIRFSRNEGYAPVEVHGGQLRAGHTVLDAGASSQYLSALLLAATAAPGPVHVEVAALTSEPYVDLTLDAIRLFGGTVVREDAYGVPDVHGRVAFRVEPGLRPPAQVSVEADLSAVAYPAAAAALTDGEVRLDDVERNSRQGDLAFLDLLGRMGAEVTWRSGGPGTSEVIVRGTGELRAVDEDLSATPDQVPTLAALAPFARGTTVIRNVPHLRLKESDRLRAMATELRRTGASVEELEDGLVIEGTWAADHAVVPNDPVICDTWDDHRIAMSMALVGLRRPNVSLRQPMVVAKSYPGFFRDLERLLERSG